MSTTPPLGSTMRILRPAPNVLAFYDGRVDGVRLYSTGRHWPDAGAYSLGVATYAVVSGAEALVYDTHLSLAHAEIVRVVDERLRAADDGIRRDPERIGAI